MKLIPLILFLASEFAFAAGALKTCPLKSQELKLASVCFSGDMKLGDETGQWLGLEENKEDLNYCFNAFVMVAPKKGKDVQLMVMKDNEKGQLKVYNYTAPEQALIGTRSPANAKAPSVVTFKNLQAQCYSRNPKESQCSKGVFGIGSSDLPFTVQLERTRGGLAVKGPERNPAAVKAPTLALDPAGEGNPQQTATWMVQTVKSRLLNVAQRRLAQVNARKLNSKTLGEATTQYHYCRMAFEAYVRVHKLADPYSASDKKTLDALESFLKVTAPGVRKK